MHARRSQYNPYTRFNPRWFGIDITSVQSDPRIYSKSRDHRLSLFSLPLILPICIFLKKASRGWSSFLLLYIQLPINVDSDYGMYMYDCESRDFWLRGWYFFHLHGVIYSTNISTDQLNHRDFCGFKGRVKNRTPF